MSNLATHLAIVPEPEDILSLKPMVLEWYIHSKDIRHQAMDKRFRLPPGTVRRWVDEDNWVSIRQTRREAARAEKLKLAGDPDDAALKILTVSKTLVNAIEGKVGSTAGVANANVLLALSNNLVRLHELQKSIYQELGLTD